LRGEAFKTEIPRKMKRDFLSIEVCWKDALLLAFAL
jgi:hypothetical protein